MNTRPPLDDPETFEIIGAAMAVHTELGHGFLEGVYKHAFSFELESRSIPFLRDVALAISYKGRPIPTIYRADFICCGSVIVEIKALSTLGPADEAQLLHYLKATGFRRGLLINFGGPSLQYRRRVFDDPGRGAAPGIS